MNEKEEEILSFENIPPEKKRNLLMIELSSASTSSKFPPMGLVASPPRSVCPPATNSNGILSSRMTKFPCQDIEKLKQKYRLQHTSCLTHLQSLIHKHRVNSFLFLFLFLVDGNERKKCLDIEMS